MCTIFFVYLPPNKVAASFSWKGLNLDIHRQSTLLEKDKRTYPYACEIHLE